MKREHIPWLNIVEEQETEVSDHNTLIMELDINWSSSTKDPAERIEIFNFKNTEHFKKFMELSENNNVLKSLFNDEDKNLEVSTQKWLKNVNKLISSSFSKIRIRKGKINPVLEQLFQEKESLKADIAVFENNDEEEKCDEYNEKLEIISEQISI